MLQQTRTIPIVFAAVSDPVGSGFVIGFPRPGGNITGFMNMEPTMAGKWMELLKEIAPRVARVALLFNPATAPYAEYWLNPFKAAAASFGVQAVAAPVHDTSELETVVAAQARESNGGLIVMPDTFTTAHRGEITALAAHHRLPAVYPFRFFAEFGGLLSYGTNLVYDFRRTATYADRILKGAKPSELPVQAPVKFELVIDRGGRTVRHSDSQCAARGHDGLRPLAAVRRSRDFQPLESRVSQFMRPPEVRPPSIAMLVPVIKAARGETRNAIRSATSSGLPGRPSGVLARSAAW